MPANPSASVRGPAHSAPQGKTPVLEAAEARQLLDRIDVTTPAGLRDRALIALMVFSLARVDAALAMRVVDVYIQHRRLWVRLHEKGGKRHEMPCHHTPDAYLHAYLDDTGNGIGADPQGPLFRTLQRGAGQLSATPLSQATRGRVKTIISYYYKHTSLIHNMRHGKMSMPYRFCAVSENLSTGKVDDPVDKYGGKRYKGS